LVIVEHTFVDVHGRLTVTQLGIHNDEVIASLKRLADVIHRSGAAAAIQLNHSGGKCNREACGVQPVGPSSMLYKPPFTYLPPFTEEMRGLEIFEIEDIVEAFGDGGRRAVEAGFNAVEIHAAHGWLLGQFHSPLVNRRRDMYGGSLENRFRLSLEIIRRVREETGDRCPLLFRLGVDDFTPGGLTVEESRIMAPKLVKAGVDVLDISGGLCGVFHPTNPSPGFYVPIADEIREVVSVPVIGVGGITTALLADELVRNRRVDMVAIGRALISDPDWGVREIGALRASV
jgi:2,4-dienoyl-CoA reductase-like NADH-dependent reductase (Old Yellow Enzyme family)